ncbi:AraC-like transcriptional regulator QhpR [Oceanobacter mangrovi]|uniref:AraC-like transcriptional regulator QhpR n=1 Tax=Oceanobacter mangrovi TaxID=2862510 RepID=UPI001C8E0F33|nr:AraC family transcriptional regulator [Oceanobacter mangrovi]
MTAGLAPTALKTRRSMVRAESSVLASATVGLEDFIDSQGARSTEVLSRAGLQQGLYQQPNRHISLKHYCNSMHEAARATGNEHFGLWFGEQFQPEGLGLFGYHAISAPDVGTAVRGMEQYFHVFQRNSLLKFEQQDDLCLLEYKLLDGDIMDRRQDAELTIGMLNNVLKRGMGKGWAPLEVHFQHPALVDAVPHRDAFECDVRFNQQRNVILFRQSCLQQPMPDANSMLHNIALGSMMELAQQQAQTLSISQRVKSEVIELLPEGAATIDEVAGRLFLSRRSLQRQLATDGYSFSSLLEEVRETLAEYYLNYNQLTISEIAFRLGYSEISAFTRAFVRWKQVNPSDWRSQ